MGPYESMATLLPVWLSIPIPIIATAYKTLVGLSPPYSISAKIKESAITNNAQTLDSIPIERPVRMVVAAPVLVAFTISFTGVRRVEVKYEVSGLNATASPTPIDVSIANRQSCAYRIATTKDH